MPVVIKRYRNRKLYNTQSKKYVTLEEIEELIKQQEEIKVIDNANGKDITAATLSLIIFGLEKNQTGMLPINLLICLVQSGGKRLEEIRRNIFNALNLAHHYDIEIERRVNTLIAKGQFSQEAGAQLSQKLISVGYEQKDITEIFEGKINELLRERQILSKRDIHNLINRIDSLSKKI